MTLRVEIAEARRLRAGLAATAQKLEKLTTAMVTMAERPAMALTPDSYATQLRRAQDDAVRAVSTELQRAQMLIGQLDRALAGG